MAIIPTHSNGQQREPACQAKETYEEFKGMYRGMTLRPVCPALKEILKIRAGKPEPVALRPGASLADRIWSVLDACKGLVQIPPVLDVVALWAHGGDLRGFLDVVREDLLVLPKQLQRDYSVSALKLEGLADELGRSVQLYEITRALHRHHVYLEPPDYARDHWVAFRSWRNDQLEAAEIGGGKLGRIEMVKLTSTFPVDAVSVASQIIDELAPIADDTASANRKANGEQAGGTTAGDTPIEHIQLENGAYKVLHTLGSSPTRLHQEDLTLCEDPPMDRRTVRRHLAELAKHGLIDYNARDKKGATITEKGKAYLNGPHK